jgi:hypothetical protein
MHTTKRRSKNALCLVLGPSSGLAGGGMPGSQPNTETTPGWLQAAFHVHGRHVHDVHDVQYVHTMVSTCMA